jgi:hypothetical protein
MNIIGVLDHVCKVTRNQIRRHRCKLRKYIINSTCTIAIADVREIIIDYSMINRKYVDIMRDIVINEGALYPDMEFFLEGMASLDDETIWGSCINLFGFHDGPSSIPMCCTMSDIVRAINWKCQLYLPKNEYNNKESEDDIDKILIYLHKCMSEKQAHLQFQ